MNIYRKLCLLAGLALLLISHATSAQRAVATVRIQTNIQKCDACKQILLNYLKREPGIISANVNTFNKIVTVRYYTERTNPLYIEYAIANAGFDADTVKANPDSYRLLPPCCKDTTQQQKPPANR
ncbi:copper chaperone CopZ [Thermoflavifilum aggregans]|uniref:Copper chaperone CopZ n=1 Tax=Thermoflavifilum aggregans TaxID=454188 RepID=A0A2M9CV58_9BACT|nr:heavy metal-associated domain-containing protein [Thermoflavifilum aggregans]MBX6379965.1 copper chaperone [Thermoflavifilum aggregans]PJJ75786.1 copper chaperone CopZ [Thermoflavifilum aggregans]